MSDRRNTVRPGSSRTKFLTLTGLMTAVICIVGPLSLPLPASPVPVTLTNFAIYIAVYVLGLKAGTVSCLIYLCLGAAGLPVFSAFSGGIGKLAGPTGGYLIGFLFLALIQGCPYAPFFRKKYRSCSRHDPWNSRMLSLRNSLAGRPDAPDLPGRAGCRGNPLSARRHCENHPCRSGRAEAWHGSAEGTAIFRLTLRRYTCRLPEQPPLHRRRLL